MTDPINQEIVEQLRVLIRNELKAALAEFEIETSSKRTKREIHAQLVLQWMNAAAAIGSARRCRN